MWSQHPEANIGSPTGAALVDGYTQFVVDVDPRHGGDKTLADLETKHGPLPETRKTRTGSNPPGWHFHLKEMCVAPNAQRRGLGGKLIAELEQYLLRQGISRVFLETGHSAPARTFYERHGYKQLSLVSLAKAIEA